MTCFSIHLAGGQTVHIGSKVNVKWLESWYEGEVMGFGPEKDLYQVN